MTAVDAIRAVLEAPIDNGGPAAPAKPMVPRRRPGVQAKQRGRTGKTQTQDDFNAKHKREQGGRAGGGRFAQESPAEHEAEQKAKELQTQLKAAGVYLGPVDGAVGPVTIAALKEFQRKNGLPQTGTIDARTQLTLKNPPPGSRAKAAEDEGKLLDKGKGARGSSGAGRGSGAGARASGKGSSKAPGGVLRQGAGMDRARGDANVKEMQTMLQDLGYDLGDAGVDGKLGPVTAKAIKAFQKEHGLKVDGVIGRHTRRLLDAVGAKQHTKRGKQDAPLSADEEPLTKRAKKATKGGTRAAEAALLMLCGSSLVELPDRAGSAI